MFITSLSFRSEAPRLNIFNEIGLDWYSDVAEVKCKGSIGVVQYGTTGCGLVVGNFSINTGGNTDAVGDGHDC